MGYPSSRILKLGVGGIQRARALGGKGYALVELKHYTEAKDCYVKCLVLDPDSEIARSELREIEQLTRNRHA